MNHEDYRFDRVEITPRGILETISVLIPTLGRPALEGCLVSIASGCRWPFEILVVDQGDNPDVVGWVAALCEAGLNTKRIASSPRGIAVARNHGIAQLQTPFAAITDDDCLVAVNWLQEMDTKLKCHPEAVVTGRVEPGAEDVVLSVITSMTPVTYNAPVRGRDVLYPNNMGCSVNQFGIVGAFDENPMLTPAEDNEWSYRALRQGVPLIYDPDIVVEHHDGRDLAGRAATYRSYARGQAAFYGKYIRKGDWHIIRRSLRSLLSGPWQWFRGIVTGNREVALRGQAYTLNLFPRIVTVILKGGFDEQSPGQAGR